MMPALDMLLILALLWLAGRALAATDLFKGVVLFIAFGLLLALAWVRLEAPDIALAEAAIGSGLTGALFLSTLGRLHRMERAAGRAGLAAATESRNGWLLRLALGVSLTAVTLLLGWAVQSLPEQSPGLANAVQGQLAASGVANVVTAVLLNFRGYDTLLEIGVLLLAVVAVWALAPADTVTGNEPAVGDREREAAGEAQGPAAGTQRPKPFSVMPQQTVLVNLLVPVMLVTAGYLLWIGEAAPGGAFQAGAVLGGAGVLLILSRPNLAALHERAWLRPALTAGLTVFLAIALAMLLRGRPLLAYPVEWAGPLIMLIETAATISIGLTLALLFLGGRPAAADPAGKAGGPDRDTRGN
jgi:multisubunit Na+/H+ antiporter MnhB subunit